MTERLELRSESGAVAHIAVHHRGEPTWGPDKLQKLLVDHGTGLLGLLEEVEYEFEIFSAGEVELLEPREVFDLSNARDGGRVRPGGRCGIVHVELLTTSGERFLGEIEVRARKLTYKQQFQWMLNRIADEAIGLALSPFAPTRLGSLAEDYTESAESLYQRFEFLRARLQSDEFASAIEQLRHRPHMVFDAQRESVPTSRPIRGGPELARQLTRPGPRFESAQPVGRLGTLPMSVDRTTHEETLDTTPNRFVRYAVGEWMALIDSVEEALVTAPQKTKTLPTVDRGLREVGRVRATLEQVMRLPAVREAGRLTHFPAANTVIQTRAGYREFLVAFQATNAMAALRWDDDGAQLSAGQHDVPTLYEYWVFLEIARIVEGLGFVVKKEDLIVRSDDGMKLQLRKGNEVAVRASGYRNGVAVDLELWFNKTFSHKPGGSNAEGSWTVNMRPDVSLSINARGLPGAEKTWLHFDAKYKVRHYTEHFADADTDVTSTGDAVPADIQKMHAYRDAIRKSAGAYVIYPGDNRLARDRYHEILPGLGAFALKPSSSGQADRKSSAGVERFISDVIDHLTSQGTAFRRDSYWSSEVNQTAGYWAPKRPFLELPPADTLVLLGFLRTPEHAAAVRSLRLYNLRADADRDGAVDVRGRELGSELLLLYGQGAATIHQIRGDIVLRRRKELQTNGYEPAGELYLCLSFDPEPLQRLDEKSVRVLALEKSGRMGAPVVATWAELEPDRQEPPR